MGACQFSRVLCRQLQYFDIVIPKTIPPPVFREKVRQQGSR